MLSVAKDEPVDAPGRALLAPAKEDTPEPQFMLEEAPAGLPPPTGRCELETGAKAYAGSPGLTA